MKKLFVALLLVAMSVVNVHAVIIDIAMGPTHSADAYLDVTSGLFTAKNINIQNVTGIDTPSNAGPNWQLNDIFGAGSNGGYVSFTATNNLGGWDWGQGGTIEAYTATGALILEGTIGSLSIDKFSANFNILGAQFTDEKADALIEFFGLKNDEGWVGHLNLSFAGTAQEGSPFHVTNGNIYSGDLVNTVPEPSTFALLGLGIAGCALLRRRNK